MQADHSLNHPIVICMVVSDTEWHLICGLQLSDKGIACRLMVVFATKLFHVPTDDVYRRVSNKWAPCWRVSSAVVPVAEWAEIKL
jgi:hypothetical protein